MKKQILIIASGILFNLANAQQIDSKEMSTKFDQLLSEQFKTNETGATALVAKNGQVLYKKAFGMADLELNIPMQADNVFRIGSITKQFTAVSILQLMEKGKLNLQDEITKFIPDYPTQGYKITIEHLLTHTSGIKSYTGMRDYMSRMTIDMKPSEMIDHFKNEPIEFTPGTKWNYSNSGYFLLGYIIEKVSGKTYEEYLEENIFRPLGMANSCYGSESKLIKNRVGTYSRGDNGFENARPLSMTQPYSAGSIQSNVEDLYKWNQAVNSYKLVKKESIAKAFTNYKLSDGKETGYGYGWSFGSIQGSPSIEHGGGINGTLTMAMYLPEEDVFVAVFSNCDCNRPEDITAKMAAIAIGKPYEYKAITLEKEVLQSYAGLFENEKGEQRVITFSDDQMYSQRGRNPKLGIKAYQKDKFFFDDAMTTIEFVRSKKGKVEELITQSREGKETWKRSNNPIAVQKEIKVDEKILEMYVGEYEIAPEFIFTVTKEKDRLFAQATGQDKFEIFSETETKFFLKVTDAQLEFVKDETGKVTKAVLKQGGRETNARRRM
jgi:CubicO group peptidase (beta-lactamase class C family)